jgi:outer membrane receptor for ferrienterochelin and colicins
LKRRVYLVALVQLYLCVFVAHGQDASVFGKVVSSTNKEVVNDAYILLDSLNIHTNSKSDGSFTITGLYPGYYIIKVSHISYEEYFHPVKLKSGDNNINISLTPSEELLSPVVITATGTKYRLDDVPVQTEIITRNDIDKIAAKSIEEAITNISSSVDFISSSMGTNIKINGMGGDYVLVLLNGKRLTGSTGGYAELDRIHPDEIEQIEIVKGATSTLYGSDAIGGVINIITKKTVKKVSVSNSTRFGAYNDIRQNNSLSFNRYKLSSKTNFSYKQTDGWQLNNMKYNSKWEDNHELPYLIVTYDLPKNKKHNYTIKQELDYKATDKSSIYANASWFEKRLFFPPRGRNYNYYYNNVDAEIGGKYTFNKSNYINYSISLGDYKYYTEYPNKYNESYITPDGLVRETYYPGDRFKNSEQKSLISNIKGIFTLNPKHTFNIGCELMGDFLEAQYRLVVENAEAFTYSVYVQDEYKPFNNVDIVGGIRLIYHDKFGFIATPKLSAMFKQQKFTWRLNYANGFKSPTLKELYYFYESERMGLYSLYLGNENLKPQQSHYLSASGEFKHNSFKVNATAYVNRLYDMIEYKIIETTYEHARRGIEETKKRYNINDARNTGIDVHTGLTLLNNWNTALNYSYVDAKNITENIRLNGISAHSASWNTSYKISWKKYRIGVTLSGTYKSDKFYLEEDEEKNWAAPYQLWNITTTHQIISNKGCDCKLIAGIDNLFDYVDDRPYGSHYGTLNPGRTLFAGLKLKFNKK